MNETYNTEQSEEGFVNGQQPVFWQIAILLLVLIGIFSSAIVHELSKFAQERDAEQERLTHTSPGLQAASIIQAKTKLPTIEDVDVLAQSAIVWDIKNQAPLYTKNADDILPLASVTKLMTALLANELLEEGEVITIDISDIKQSGDSGLMDGEQFSLENLNDLVLMTSSNDGAHALAGSGGEALGLDGDTAFVTAMNIRAEQLGLPSLHFLNPTGLDLSPTEAGAFGSASDIAKLIEYIIAERPEILAATTDNFSQINNRAGAYHEAQNTNGIVEEIEGLIGSKTGYTDIAGGNLVVAFESGLDRPIVIVVLGSTRVGRFEDVLELVTATKYIITQ